MSRPVIVRATRKAETLRGLAEGIEQRFKSYKTPMHSDAKREVSALQDGADCLEYFAQPDRMSFGHLCRLRQAVADLLDARTPTEANEARAECERLRAEIVTFTEGEES